MTAAISPVYSDPPAAAKSAARQRALAQRRALGETARATASAAICAKILALAEYQQASSIAAFAPMDEEVNIWPVIGAALQSGKTVALPRVAAEKTIIFHRLNETFDGHPIEFAPNLLDRGYKGILQPPADWPVVSPDLFDFLLTPAAAADSRRNRLGYGGGFYDIFLPLARRAPSFIPIFRCQMLDHIPTQTHDRRVCGVITE